MLRACTGFVLRCAHQRIAGSSAQSCWRCAGHTSLRVIQTSQHEKFTQKQEKKVWL
jgi:hypothetical protein